MLRGPRFVAAAIKVGIPALKHRQIIVQHVDPDSVSVSSRLKRRWPSTAPRRSSTPTRAPSSRVKAGSIAYQWSAAIVVSAVKFDCMSAAVSASTEGIFDEQDFGQNLGGPRP